MLEITDKEFKQLTTYIKENYGIYLKDEKRTLVTGRLHNILIQNNFRNFSEYYQYIISDKTGSAASALINKITTNHTYFMRESDHFIFFRDKVLPYLKGSVKDQDLRIWSAGCSTGEEPYTLAMLIDDFYGKEKAFWNTKILASDISERVLKKALSGIYSNESIETLPSHWKFNYFIKKDGDNSVVHDKIKNEVIYRRFNLMDKIFPFKRKFHVIFCRNVMIYFDNHTKAELINKFYNSLEYGGYFFIGHSEAIKTDESAFRHVMPAVYRKE